MRPVCRLLRSARTSLCLAALTTACAGRAAPEPPGRTGPASAPTEPVAHAAPVVPVADDACAIGPDAGAPIVRVGLLEAPDPSHAPVPENDSERLLFAHLYETLVTVDCEGVVRPALAAEWRYEPATMRWTFTIREDARFADGVPVTAQDVVSAWVDPRSSVGDLREPVRRHLQSAAVADARTVAVTFHEPRDAPPEALADPALAVARRVPGSPWPVGTRGWQVTSTASGGAMSIVLRATEVRDRTAPVTGAATGAAPELRFLVARTGDGRDLLDAGVDLLLTREPAVLSYAVALAQFETRPLPWTRTYVFVSPENSAPAPLPDAARRALADDAVRGDARGAEVPAWWQEVAGCVIPAVRIQASVPASTRLVYAQDDAVARDLAERIVALFVARRTDALAVVPDLLRSRRTTLQATGLRGQALTAALARGADAAYLLPIDRLPTDRCAALRTLTARAPWLSPAALVPLVDTRLQAIVRTARSRVHLRGDGTLLIQRPPLEP